MKTWLLRFALFLGALLVVAVVAEVALRIAHDEDEWTFRFRTVTSAARDNDGRYRAHPRRIYAVAPHYRQSPTHAGRYATDRWPLRGRPDAPLPETLLRVAVLGDSCIYGAGLHDAETLSGRLADRLAPRGWTADRVGVFNYGVPGYSTVLIDMMLEEVLETLRPDAVVIYPAAWNDQVPALQASDAELVRRLTDPSPLDRLTGISRLAARARHAYEGVPFEEVMAGAARGTPPLGDRVPAEEVGPNVSRMLERCAEAGVPVCIVVPAHPQRTLKNNPRTRRDAGAVRRTARRAGVHVVDGPALLAASGRDDAHHFLDGVHPSPAALDTFAGPVATWLADHLGDPGRVEHAAPLAITGVEPPEAIFLGDVPVRVELDRTLDQPPAISVGAAPLLGLARDGERAWVGTLVSNGPAGPHDVVVQTADACAVRPAGLRLRAPSVTFQPGGALRFQGRPGDTAILLHASERRSVPEWKNAGSFELGGDIKAVPGRFVGGPDGAASLTLPPALRPDPDGTPRHYQLKIAPAGHELTDGAAVRWGPLVSPENGSR